eukprot:CAMPEP_0197523438 /NCGR_PEP_ID=MMETSP1318-20131121/8361_1 /TAXON_ID=552666 /ORGANISM="Partenskyella glossopodia, Strain RCC365" /LENGTH=270 /DNA_ID=CAMNT_0043076127 /DNA_START=228 /DNA_END=1041 /DNA_ORIENTATION=+
MIHAAPKPFGGASAVGGYYVLDTKFALFVPIVPRSQHRVHRASASFATIVFPAIVAVVVVAVVINRVTVTGGGGGGVRDLIFVLFSICSLVVRESMRMHVMFPVCLLTTSISTSASTSTSTSTSTTTTSTFTDITATNNKSTSMLSIFHFVLVLPYWQQIWPPVPTEGGATGEGVTANAAAAASAATEARSGAATEAQSGAATEAKSVLVALKPTLCTPSPSVVFVVGFVVGFVVVVVVVVGFVVLVVVVVVIVVGLSVCGRGGGRPRMV